MVLKVLNSTWSLLALASLAAVSGCCCLAIPLPGECQCPTDARRLYCTCGEEAVRRCPCGPGSEFFGLKPTCWREWPEGWQCNGCEGMPYVDRALCGVPVAVAPVVETPVNAAPTVATPSKSEVEVSNPFRSKTGAAELPIPPQARPITPTQTAPENKAAAPLTPAQPTPTAPPALEKVPSEAPPAKPTPNETTPSIKSSTEKPADQKPNVVAAAQPATPVKTPANSPVVQAEATVPKPMPFVPEAVKITAPTPILMAPLNAPQIESVAESNPKPIQVATSPKCEKTQAVKKIESSKRNDNRADNPVLSDRVERHLINNLRL